MTPRRALDALGRSRGLRAAAWLAALSWVLGEAFAWTSRTRGLLAPGGAVHPGVVALGVGALVARVAATFAVPGILAGTVALALLEWTARRR